MRYKEDERGGQRRVRQKGGRVIEKEWGERGEERDCNKGKIRKGKSN